MKSTTCKYNTISEYPICLRAEEVAEILGVSRTNAYQVMRSKGFPTVRVGHRLVVPRDKLIEWIEQQLKEGAAFR